MKNKSLADALSTPVFWFIIYFSLGHPSFQGKEENTNIPKEIKSKPNKVNLVQKMPVHFNGVQECSDTMKIEFEHSLNIRGVKIPSELLFEQFA